MKQLLLLLIVALPLFSMAENIEIKGTYQGENLYVKNPFASSGVGFCVYEVTVNGMTSTDEINSSAFEIDLNVFGFRIGEQITVAINYKEGCTPRVLNPDVLSPRATFEIESLKIEGENLVWTTRNESGPLPYHIEQFRWNKWVTIGEVTGKGVPGAHSYSVPLRLHAGENRFRIRQTDTRKQNKYSAELNHRTTKPAVTYTIATGGNEVVFSQPTMYEVYDNYGRIVFKGFGDQVKIGPLEKGRYYLNFDNKLDYFIKR
jgi:hypothetical protein